ncbi:hypothetical protein Q4543_17500 [Salipiger sp. 1_MG-2023]|uniref:hypothetical protein n=1 Tax=Salipiger sp. 1_MG-2023 TaxID=3062665 RepID=UPI0026E2B47C|nr:hypothetical protein [Salipiger sp. 1_MG-2023]MDO6587311.1 hypothetical protein [Salipiger sp. 1_MG-2023]
MKPAEAFESHSLTEAEMAYIVGVEEDTLRNWRRNGEVLEGISRDFYIFSNTYEVYNQANPRTYISSKSRAFELPSDVVDRAEQVIAGSQGAHAAAEMRQAYDAEVTRLRDAGQVWSARTQN